MKTFAPWLLGFALCGAAFAQDVKPEAGRCDQCLASAAADRQRCEAAAKEPAAREACAKRFSEVQLGCQLSACKPGQSAPDSASCPECQHRAAEDERNCRSMGPGSAGRIACEQRVSRMRARCDETSCKNAPK
jgi:hypothetical protein